MSMNERTNTVSYTVPLGCLSERAGGTPFARKFEFQSRRPATWIKTNQQPRVLGTQASGMTEQENEV